MHWWKRMFLRGRMTDDLSEEMRQHLEEKIDALIAGGMPREEAIHAARRAFGNTTLLEEHSREVWMWPWIESVWADVKFALRQLRKSPGFTVTAVVTLALGIGTATAMFAIVFGVLLRPLPFRHSKQLYQPVGINAKAGELFGVPYADIQQWREATRNTAEIAFSGRSLSILDTPEGAELISNVESSSNLLSVLGVQPIMGRSFLAREEENGDFHVVLLSYSLWRRAFSADRNILGKTVHLGKATYTVIGVMPPQFHFPAYENQAEVWTPLEQSKLSQQNVHDSYGLYDPVLRIKPGSKLATIQTELSNVQASIAQAAQPGVEVARNVRLIGLHAFLVEGARPALTALDIAVVLIWLIACFNVAGLLLARIAARRTEIAVRGALGAGRGRIVRQFLVESLLLSCAGAMAGFGMAIAMLQLFQRMLLKSLPLSKNIHLNWAVFAVLIGLTLFTGFVFGVFPATVAAKTHIEGTLKRGGHNSSGDRAQSRLRNLLLVSEIALSIVLLVGAGLMMRTMYALRHVPLGFRTDHIVLTTLTVPDYIYKNRNLNAAAWGPLLERVRRLPSVQGASLSTILPIAHPVEILTLVYATEWTKGNVDAAVRAASPGLMHVLGIQMRAGRFFTAEDTTDSMPVAVVNQAFVNRYLGGHAALGKQIRFGRVPSKATIVGVLGNIHQDGIAEASRPEFYLCMNQLQPSRSLYLPLIGRFMELAIRTQTTPGAIIPELRHAIRRENPNLLVGDFVTMNQAVEDSIGGQRLAAQVIGVFGGLAILITVVGLNGLLSYSVTQRTQEIGVRMALGATRLDILRLILWEGLRLIALGGIVGLAVALALSQTLKSLLFMTSPYDPASYISIILLLILIALVGTWIPARHAVSVDPMQALRAE